MNASANNSFESQIELELDVQDELGRQPEPLTDKVQIGSSLTAMRKYVTQTTDARFFLGGKRVGFEGKCPGIFEESEMAISAGQPIYLAGGFGGATSDLAAAWVLEGRTWIPEEIGHSDECFQRAFKIIQDLDPAIIKQSLDNGLTDIEQRQLAVTHRPSEVAALVSLGMARRFADNR
jgi:SLOG cluster2